MGNSILNKAKYSSHNTDEWYTDYKTIEAELSHYEEQFNGKKFYAIVIIHTSPHLLSIF